MRLPTLALALLALTGTALAQTPPPPAKRLPPAGIAIPEKDRIELTAGAAALRQEIEALRRSIPADNARELTLLPDVEIFHKAVDWALRYDEFFAAKEVDFARHLLAEGHDRAQHFRDAEKPWLVATGLIVRGYRSKLDGSVQPYGLVVPKNWKRDQPGRLEVWLLGRGEKRTELAFLAEREAKPPEVVPKDTLVLIPYGRYCNATKFAGEVDVFEAMDDVRAHYAIDPLRTSVAGFSMGGASVWHLAVHHSGLWSSASPGAGFAEAAIYTKAFAPGKIPPTWWEQKLWHWYNATDVAGNLFNVPTIAYSGEIDPQKQSADLMEEAMAKEGLKLERFIGPQTAHKYEPATKEKLVARLETINASGRPPKAREVSLTTYSLQYPGDSWVRILAMEKQWERADVHAILSTDGTGTITTKNVTALALGEVLPGRQGYRPVFIDGQKVTTGPNQTDFIGVFKVAGKWTASPSARFIQPHKGPQLNGPIDDAFMREFIFVRPTGKPLNEKVGAWTNAELEHASKMWRDIFRGVAPAVDDIALSKSDRLRKNLILWGDPSSNKVISEIIDRLPITWTADKIIFRGQAYDAAHHAPIFIFPNPLSPENYIVLNSGMDFRDDAYGTNALQIPKLPDYAIVDLNTPPGPKWPGKIVDAGFFDEEWK